MVQLSCLLFGKTTLGVCPCCLFLTSGCCGEPLRGPHPARSGAAGRTPAGCATVNAMLRRGHQTVPAACTLGVRRAAVPSCPVRLAPLTIPSSAATERVATFLGDGALLHLCCAAMATKGSIALFFPHPLL